VQYQHFHPAVRVSSNMPAAKYSTLAFAGKKKIKKKKKICQTLTC
jgi:hypothetical protein